MSSPNPDHVMYGVKVLARLLVTQGPGYVSKFAARANGFPILRKYLCPWWEITPIWPTLLAVLFGVDVVSLKSLPVGQPLRLFDLVQLVKLGDENPTVISCFPRYFLSYRLSLKPDSMLLYVPQTITLSKGRKWQCHPSLRLRNNMRHRLKICHSEMQPNQRPYCR